MPVTVKLASFKRVHDPGQLRYPKKFVFSFEKCDQAVVDEHNFCVQPSRL